MSNKKTLALVLLPILAGALAFASFFYKPNSTVTLPEAAPTMARPAQPSLPAGTREISQYKVEGDNVFVNNTICAQMGAPLAPEAMGMFTTAVVYDGPSEIFKGKTLIFNQCCEHCVANFPQKWAKERDQIMRTHGLETAG